MPAAASPDIDPDALATMVEGIVSGGYAVKDFTGHTPEQIEAVYAVGLQHLDAGRVDQAEHVFQFLCQLDQYDARFWLALGAVRQVKRNYEQAVKAYTVAALHDPGSPVPGLRAAECFLILGDLENAESGATAAVYFSEGNPAHAETAARGSKLLETIRRKKANQPGHDNRPGANGAAPAGPPS